MSEHPPGPDGAVHPSVNYEQTDLRLSSILTFTGGLVVLLAVCTGAMFLLAWSVVGAPPPVAPIKSWDFEGEPGPEAGSSYLPGKPELEAIDQNTPGFEGRGVATHPIRDQVRDEEDRLGGYGWADEKKGTVYIPIERAMERLGGKPAPAPTRPSEGPGVSAVSTSGRLTPGGAP